MHTRRKSACILVRAISRTSKGQRVRRSTQAGAINPSMASSPQSASLSSSAAAAETTTTTTKKNSRKAGAVCDVPIHHSTSTSSLSPLIDIGCNLTDPMFRGVYRGKQHHPDDFDAVLQRGWSAGLEKIIVTAGSLEDARASIALANSDSRFFSTVGVHPTRCSQEFLESEEGGDAYMLKLVQVAREGKALGKVVAIGEIGLDWDRLNFCPKEVQIEWFEKQLVELAAKLDLPLFLHCRAAGDEMVEILQRHGISNGVVHSYDGSLSTMLDLVNQGLYIGINGCSLRTEENLHVVANIPADRLLLETDGPWCDIRKTHPGHVHVRTKWPTVSKPKKWVEGKCVRSRQEPCHLRQVLEVCAGVRGVDPNELAHQVYENTCRLFFPSFSQSAAFDSRSSKQSEKSADKTAKLEKENGLNLLTSMFETSTTSPGIPLGHTSFSWKATGTAAIGHTSYSWGAKVAKSRLNLESSSHSRTPTKIAGISVENLPECTDKVQTFELDDDFDYDGVELSQRRQTVNGWEESSSGKSFKDFVDAAGGEGLLMKQLHASVVQNVFLQNKNE